MSINVLPWRMWATVQNGKQAITTWIILSFVDLPRSVCAFSSCSIHRQLRFLRTVFSHRLISTVAHKYHGKSLKQATYLQLFHDNINLKTGTQFYKPQQTLKKDCSKSFQSTATKVSSSRQKFQVHGKSFTAEAKYTGSNER